MVEKVLEIHQWWGDELLDARTFTDRDRVSIGLVWGPRWRFLGVEMGRVPRALGPVLAALAPMWSDVDQERTADFAVPEPCDGDDDDWDLVVRRPDGLVLRVPAGWDLDCPGVDVDGVREVPVGDETATVGRGEFRFEVRLAPRAERVESRMLVGLDTIGVVGTVATALSLVALLSLVAPPASAVVERPNPEGMADVMLMLPPPPPAATPKKDTGGARAAKPEGAAPKTKDPPAPGKRTDAKVAGEAGVAGMLDDSIPGAALDAALTAGVGSLIGAHGSGPGGDGLGSRGPGIGGGGEYDGAGPTGGRGHVPGDGYGGDVGGKKREGTIDTPESFVLLGTLDRAQVDEVIKRNLSAIRFCYQRELQHQPDLAGKVTMRFVIGRDGGVSSAHAIGSLSSPSVQTCLEGRFLHMKFPEPAGAGTVAVAYPLIFSPG